MLGLCHPGNRSISVVAQCGDTSPQVATSMTISRSPVERLVTSLPIRRASIWTTCDRRMANLGYRWSSRGTVGARPEDAWSPVHSSSRWTRVTPTRPGFEHAFDEAIGTVEAWHGTIISGGSMGGKLPRAAARRSWRLLLRVSVRLVRDAAAVSGTFWRSMVRRRSTVRRKGAPVQELFS